MREEHRTRAPRAGAAADPSPGAVTLRYGEGHFLFRFDPGRFEVVAPADFEEGECSDAALDEWIGRPVGSPPLEELVAPGDRVVLVVPDATRAAGVARIVAALVRRLSARGLADEQVSILIGGGIHRPPTPAEVEAIVGPGVSRRLAVHPHDANDYSLIASLGETRRGTPVELNRRLVEADRVLVVGGITFHYIAGFSGGRKAVLPGCASERAIQANHLVSFDLATLEKREGIASGSLDGNPVSEDMIEAVSRLDPTFLVNSVLNSRGEVTRVYAGHWRDAHRRGCDEYAATHAVEVAERRPLVIVSVGGSPRDINLIQSHKAMEHASAILEDGGTMIALAECAQGLGRDDFLRWFVPGGSRATAEMLLRDYKINGQTAWGLRRKAERFRMLLVSSLPEEVVRRTGLEPHASLESALASAPAGVRGYVVPGGLTTLPRVAAGPRVAGASALRT